jgi:hypothetical protein
MVILVFSLHNLQFSKCDFFLVRIIRTNLSLPSHPIPSHVPILYHIWASDSRTQHPEPPNIRKYIHSPTCRRREVPVHPHRLSRDVVQRAPAYQTSIHQITLRRKMQAGSPTVVLDLVCNTDKAQTNTCRYLRCVECINEEMGHVYALLG